MQANKKLQTHIYVTVTNTCIFKKLLRFIFKLYINTVCVFIFRKLSLKPSQRSYIFHIVHDSNVLSSAGLSWRSPPVVSTMTVSRLMLLEPWRLPSHLRLVSTLTLLLSLCFDLDEVQRFSLLTSFCFAIHVSVAHLQALDEHTDGLLWAL